MAGGIDSSPCYVCFRPVAARHDQLRPDGASPSADVGTNSSARSEFVRGSNVLIVCRASICDIWRYALAMDKDRDQDHDWSEPLDELDARLNPYGRHSPCRARRDYSGATRRFRPLHEFNWVSGSPTPNPLTAQRKYTRVNQVCFRILDLMPRARKASEIHAEGMIKMVNAAGFLATRPCARKLAKIMDGVNKHG